MVFFGLESLTQLTSSRIISVLLTTPPLGESANTIPVFPISAAVWSFAVDLDSNKDTYSDHLLPVSYPGPHSLCIHTANASHSHRILLYEANTSVPNLEMRK